MDRLIILMVLTLASGALYSYVAGKFTKNKWILYLPTYLGLILISYIIIFFKPEGQGFQDLAKVIMILLLAPIVIGNTIGNIVVKRR